MFKIWQQNNFSWYFPLNSFFCWSIKFYLVTKIKLWAFLSGFRWISFTSKKNWRRFKYFIIAIYTSPCAFMFRLVNIFSLVPPLEGKIERLFLCWLAHIFVCLICSYCCTAQNLCQQYFFLIVIHCSQ